MRLFVSIDVPDDLQESLRALGGELADAEDLRLVDPSGAHLTLFFLGDVPEDTRPDVEDAINRAVEDAGVPPFTLELGDIGVFPSLDYISVVWVGVREGAAETTALHDAVAAELEELGFEDDDHEFTPHVTLGRMDGHRGKERIQEIVTERDPDVGSFRVEEVRLTESTLTEDGPEYSTVESFPLSAE